MTMQAQNLSTLNPLGHLSGMRENPLALIQKAFQEKGDAVWVRVGCLGSCFCFIRTRNKVRLAAIGFQLGSPVGSPWCPSCSWRRPSYGALSIP